jgi:2-amino-4-deoxychorismate synthase
MPVTTAQTKHPHTLLQQAIDGALESYALIYRHERYKEPTLEILTGSERRLDSLAALEQIQDEQRETDHWGTLLVTPYCQIKERGFEVIDDQTPFLALDIERCETVAFETALAALPGVSVNLKNSFFNPDDETYKNIVDKIIKQEIGTGEGANFVIKRTLNGQFSDYDDHVGLTIFRNLLKQEQGTYWTFFIRMRDITLVGASPEMHIKRNANLVSMTPVSGTYRFPPSGPTQEGLLAFLCNTKEEDELSMVLDEELKMMTHICSSDVRAHGPYLVQMSKLAHVGYRLEGSTDLSISQILQRSMFAPTVTGSPLENATRVIARYETCGRSYYSGFAALIENNDDDAILDSAILIRTVEISNDGKMQVGVGATLVRDSDPLSETKETAAKVAGLQNAMGVTSLETLAEKGPVIQSLSKRNERLSSFWLSRHSGSYCRLPTDTKKPAITIIDNEDAFTSMIKYQLKEIGFQVNVKIYSSIGALNNAETLIVGPGPGDPCKVTDPRVATSRRIMIDAMETNQFFISICFGHQILCSLLGLAIEPLRPPNQGFQKQISIFGKTETVGFYNTFTAVCDSDYIESPFGKVRVYRDLVSKQVYGLKGPNFCSMQFHPESVLTKDGQKILADAVMSERAECVLS